MVDWGLDGGRVWVELPSPGIWDLVSSDETRLVRFVGEGRMEVDASVLVAEPSRVVLVRSGTPDYRLIPWRVMGGELVIVLVHGLLRCEVRDGVELDSLYGCARKREYWSVWKRLLASLCPDCDIWEFVYPSHWAGSVEHARMLVAQMEREGLTGSKILLIGHSFGGIVVQRAAGILHTNASVVGIASPYRGTPLVDFSYASLSDIKGWFGEVASAILAFRSRLFASGNSVVSPAHKELFWNSSPLEEVPPDLLVSPWLEVQSDIPLLLETLQDAQGETLASARLITVLGSVAFGEDLSYNDGVVPMRSSGDGAFSSGCQIMHVAGDHETPLMSESIVRGVWQRIHQKLIGGEV